MNNWFYISILAICIIVIGIMANDMLHEQFLLKTKANSTALLSKSLDMGVTELNVHDLELMEMFYVKYADLEVLKKEEGKVILGHDKRRIITLIKSNEKKSPVRSAGLYHNAIVFSSRGQLARTIKVILEEVPQYFAGTADHLVSEAFYFTDPEGNGLELYFDKDESTWEWQDGQIKMDSIYIDPIAYINRYAPEDESTEKHMGHVHLKVGDIAQAKKFYTEVLGFDITAELGSALFISVGGYHHHIGLNTWESNGVGKRKPSLGLQSFELILDSKEDILALKNRLNEHEVSFSNTDESIIIQDPWDNNIVIRNK